MNGLYKISISGPDSDDVVVIATAEVSDTEARITEIQTEFHGNSVIPQKLKDLDFPLLIQTASILSGYSEPGESSSISEEASSIPEPCLQEPEAPDEPSEETTLPHTAPTVGTTRDARNSLLAKTDMPMDFGVNYWRLGSISKVAKHYDVPHHIAQDWIKTLQQQGKAANPWPNKGKRTLR